MQNGGEQGLSAVGQSVGGIGSFLGALGQMNFGKTGARAATMGQGNSVLTPGNTPTTVSPYLSTGYQLPNNYYEGKF